jgi:exonuclease SbcC
MVLHLRRKCAIFKKNDKNSLLLMKVLNARSRKCRCGFFETLQSLYKENRIVGIISHVAELQERIPCSINVIKDEEKGSVVTGKLELD